MSFTSHNGIAISPLNALQNYFCFRKKATLRKGYQQGFKGLRTYEIHKLQWKLSVTVIVRAYVNKQNLKMKAHL